MNVPTSSTSRPAPRSARGGTILPWGWNSDRSRSKSGWVPGGNETDSYIAFTMASTVATSGCGAAGDGFIPRAPVDNFAMSEFLQVMRDIRQRVTEYTPKGSELQFDFEPQVEYVHALAHP